MNHTLGILTGLFSRAGKRGIVTGGFSGPGLATSRLLAAIALSLLTSLVPQQGCAENTNVADHARAWLEAAGMAKVRFAHAELGHAEAFRVVKQDGQITIEHQDPAGALYGSQAVVFGDYRPGELEKPDLEVRGTTLCLMSGGNDYKSTLSPEIFPWFYDKPFMARTLDAFAAARINTIFAWAGHLFPYIVEMPDYPEASADVPPEQVKRNQEQFRWFTAECEKRNIQVLLHFYNIHVSPPFAKKHGIRTNPATPTPLLREYTYYALSRYFREFPSVGLYACPGESLASEHQLEWFRDVIFKAAKESGKNPLIVIRDWTLNLDFQKQLKSLYGNVHSELKHHDESVTSPYPDVRHLKWEGLTHGHIINAAHGPAEDLAPVRWASPVFVQEMAQHWQALGFVKGVEFWMQSYWRWPYSYDRLTAAEPGSVVDADGLQRLLYLDRDAPFLTLAGRAMWKADRDPAADARFWADYHAKRFGSRKIGGLMAEWYTVSGPISPGLQNLNATKVANFWATLLLMNQNIDQILDYNKDLAQTPYTLDREAGRADQRTYPRPYDAYFFDRYRTEYGLPKPGRDVKIYDAFTLFQARMGVADLAQRHVMPVSQYAKLLEQGGDTGATMTPDKAVRLLHQLAKESLAIAEAMQAACTDSAHLPELRRFVSDSKIYVLATQAMMHKEDAAILKARMLAGGAKAEHAAGFLREMEASAAVYQELATLADQAYLFANGLRRYRWSQQGIAEFKADLERQKKWLQDSR
ncbi:MAG: hypothetical protein MUF86_15640 [Akkermansiaceae bacterium]|nr:hypothetical protein [Akkermansiaceae bacterium]